MGFGFREFLLNENQAYLGHRVSDILNGIQELLQNFQGMGTRHAAASAEQVVNMIRRILHTHWPPEQEEHLKNLQKAGVAIMQAIEEKGDLKGILQGAEAELKKVASKLDVPANKLGTPEGVEQAPEPSSATGPPQPNQPQETPPEDSQGAPGGQGAIPPLPPEGQSAIASPPPSQ